MRSIRASEAGLEIARDALKRSGHTQEYLAGSVGCTRQVVIKFFARKFVEGRLFRSICSELGLEWVDIAEFEAESKWPSQTSNFDALVQEIRKKVSHHIQRRCSAMRVLDMEQPITLDSIHIGVNILEKITRNQRRSIHELLEGCDLENFDRLSLGRVQQERTPGLAAVQRHDKLLVLGKPGAGKTTFLKWLALQCDAGRLYQNYVPIFVTLKEFAEASRQTAFIHFIAAQWMECGVENAQATVEQVLQAGRALILLDGLDEVRAEDNNFVLNTIEQIARRFDTNRFVMTCRIAAKEYTFAQFTEVEVDDFDEEQIADFAQKWFQHKAPPKAAEFSKELEAEPGLQELATNPLLLTLLCLVFEERAEFPVNRAELYKEGLDVLLKKWDGKRNIKRDMVYKELSLNRKEDLLSQIAFITFERSDYFFKQKFVEGQIQNYICNLPNAKTDSEALQLDSEAVLKSIEAQHGLLIERARGIYSFSHLTFQEYFTARQIEKSNSNFSKLVNHITEKRWHEVFLLTVGMLQDADELLLSMKAQTDKLLANDEQLQQFLNWVSQKSRSINVPYKPAAVRAFYYSLYLSSSLFLNLPLEHVLDLAIAYNTEALFIHDKNSILTQDTDLALIRGVDLKLTRDVDNALSYSSNLDMIRDLDSILAQDVNIEHKFAFSVAHALVRTLILDIALTHSIDVELKHKLKQLREELPDSLGKNQKSIQQWWQANSQNWTEQLRTLMIQHCNIGHNWGFNEHQKILLRQYFEASRLIMDCLSSDCYVSREVRQIIEESLFLPIAEAMS